MPVLLLDPSLEGHAWRLACYDCYNDRFGESDIGRLIEATRRSNLTKSSGVRLQGRLRQLVRLLRGDFRRNYGPNHDLERGNVAIYDSNRHSSGEEGDNDPIPDIVGNNDMSLMDIEIHH